MSFSFISYLRDLDLALFHFLNGVCGQSLTLDPHREPTGKCSIEGLGLHGHF